MLSIYFVYKYVFVLIPRYHTSKIYKSWKFSVLYVQVNQNYKYNVRTRSCIDSIWFQNGKAITSSRFYYQAAPPGFYGPRDPGDFIGLLQPCVICHNSKTQGAEKQRRSIWKGKDSLHKSNIKKIRERFRRNLVQFVRAMSRNMGIIVMSMQQKLNNILFYLTLET